MAVPKFWVPYLKWDAFVADSPAETGGDADTDPDKKGIHGGVEITASLSKGDIRSIRALTTPDHQLYALGVQDTRLDDGHLKLTAAQQEFGLLAKSDVLDLPAGVDLIYTFRPHHVTYNGMSQTLPTITVKAPVIPEAYDPEVSGPFVLNLADMEWLNPSTARSGGFVVRQVPDDVTLVGPNLFQFWASGSPLGEPLALEIDGGGGPGGTVAWADIEEMPDFVAAGATQAAARAVIDAVGSGEMDAALSTLAGGLQPADADLTAIAALASAADKLLYATGAGTWALTDFTAFARSILDDVDAAAVRQTLGVRPGTEVQAYSSVLAGIAAVASTGSRIFYTTDGGTTWLAATSTSFGRQVGAVADAAALRTLLGSGAANGLAPLDANSLIPPVYLPSYVDDVIEAATTAGFPVTGETGKIYTALNAGTPVDPSRIYRWSGSAYVEISPSPGSTDAVTEGASNLYFTNARADARITAARGSTIQAYSAILAAIAALTLVNDNLLQVKGGVVTQRTPAQFKTDLALAKGDVGLGNANNTADADKPISTAMQTALDAKQPIVESVNVVPASGAAQTIPDPAAQSMSRITLTANCTLTFPAPVAGKSFSVALVQDATGGRTVTWPATARWAGGTAPTLTAAASKVDRLTFLCDDGATYAGFVAGLNFS